LVDLFEYMMMHGLTNPKQYSYKILLHVKQLKAEVLLYMATQYL